MSQFSERVIAFRESINQTVEAIALLLNLSVKEYQDIENGVVPSDEVLQRLCSLFSWNYNEVKRLTVNTPAPAAAPISSLPLDGGKANLPFHQMLQDARLAVAQSPEGVAMLLNIPVTTYEKIEEGMPPSDDVVRKICTLFTWNYQKIRQSLINQSTPRMGTAPPPMSLTEFQKRQGGVQKELNFDNEYKETLGSLLVKAREAASQTHEGIALLLNIDVDHYQELEQGRAPDAELLKRISTLFNWNHNELQLLVHNENIQEFQPAVTQSPTNYGTPNFHKLSEIQKDIMQYWSRLKPSQQETLMGQLELIRDSARLQSGAPAKLAAKAEEEEKNKKKE